MHILATYNCQVQFQLPDYLKNAETDLFSVFILLLQRVFLMKHARDSHPGRHVRWKRLSYKHRRKHNILRPSMASVLVINLHNLRWISASLKVFLPGKPFWFVWRFGFSNLQIFTSYSYVFLINNAQTSLVFRGKQPNFTGIIFSTSVYREGATSFILSSTVLKSLFVGILVSKIIMWKSD